MGDRRFKVSMLEYSKTILSKFRFNRKLFLKEYRKALRYLGSQERLVLKHWVRTGNIDGNLHRYTN